MLNIAKIRKEWFIEQIVTLKNSGIQYAEIAARLGIRPQYLNSIKNSERGASENLTMYAGIPVWINIGTQEIERLTSHYMGEKLLIPIMQGTI